MRTIGFFVLATGLLTSVAWSQQYAVVDLGTLGGSVSVAKGVNNSGQVTGYAETPDGGVNAFLYTSGTMINIGGSSGNSINDYGDVGGTTHVATGQPHAFKYSSGVFYDLDLEHPHRQSFGFSINNAGDVAGTLTLADTGVVFTSNGIKVLPRGVFNVVEPAAMLPD